MEVTITMVRSPGHHHCKYVQPHSHQRFRTAKAEEFRQTSFPFCKSNLGDTFTCPLTTTLHQTWRGVIKHTTTLATTFTKIQRRENTSSVIMLDIEYVHSLELLHYPVTIYIHANNLLNHLFLLWQSFNHVVLINARQH